MDSKLYEAAASGDIPFLQQVTDPMRDLDKVTPQKNTVLHIAVNFKQLEFSKEVLGLCSSLLQKANEKGESPLHVAAKIGCLEIAEHLLNSARTLHQDVEAQRELLRMVNQEKDTALHVAVKKGHLAVSKLLMEADPELLEFVNSANASPLYLAVDGKFFDITKCILEFSQASHRGPEDMTALHSAVIREQHEIVKVLLEKRRDMIKEVDKLGWTPLLYAARGGVLETTQLLLKQQCDSSTYILDKDGTSALHVAASKGHIHIVEELIKSCPDIVESTDKKGRTALHVAVINGQERMVRYILKKPTQLFFQLKPKQEYWSASIINEQDEDGNTALHLAVMDKRVNIIKYLALDRRVEKTAMNKAFSTAHDIFLSQTNQPSYSAAKTHYFLTEARGTPYFQHLIDTFEKRKNMGEASDQEKSDLAAAKDKSDERMRSRLEIHLLVATLIATVTFQSAFTMPGGYDDKGMANFRKRAMFQAFVILNTAAFHFSIASVFLHFAISTQSKSFRTRYTNLAVMFIFFALLAMVLAFASAMYLMLSKSVLRMIPCIMAATILLGYQVFFFLDPENGYNRGFSKARENLRNLLFHCRII